MSKHKRKPRGQRDRRDIVLRKVGAREVALRELIDRAQTAIRRRGHA